MGAPKISICDVKHSPEVVQIRLKNSEMPGWFAQLQMEPGEIAYLIEQKFCEIKNEKQEKAEAFEVES
ncbi:hypothetical protein KA005_00865 [bacterium]|nr:hypothetical protein [bacterium]